MGLPRSGIPPRGGAEAALGRAADGGGAAYTGRGPVCGTINLRGGGVRCAPAGGFAAAGAWETGAAGTVPALPDESGVAAWATGDSACGASTAGAATSRVSTGMGTCSSARGSAGLVVSFTGGTGVTGAAGDTAAGGFGGMMTAAGGRATDCGVMKRGAGFGASTGTVDAVLAAAAGGLATVLGGRAGTADGGATVCRGGAAAVAAAETAERGATCGWAAFCVIAFITSPGLEICDRSILGLNSSACARELRVELLAPGSPCSA